MNSSPSSGRKYQRTGDRYANELVIFTKVHNINESGLRRMPIDSNNELPHIKFPLGDTNGFASITVLYDTGAALNTGSLMYHQNIMEKHPHLVASYDKFDGDNPFDPIKLCDAISDPSAYDEDTHGSLLAVFTYKTPFVNTITNKAISISFALGNDISVDTVIGIPTIDEYEIEMRFQPEQYLTSRILERSFSIVYRETVRTLVKIVDNTSTHGAERSHFSQLATVSEVLDQAQKADLCPLSQSDITPAYLRVPLNYYTPNVVINVDDNDPPGKKVRIHEKATGILKPSK